MRGNKKKQTTCIKIKTENTHRQKVTNNENVIKSIVDKQKLLSYNPKSNPNPNLSMNFF
jgi:hypothetical protein